MVKPECRTSCSKSFERGINETMTNTTTNNTKTKKSTGAMMADNKWLKEFEDITVDESEVANLDAQDKPQHKAGESFQEIFEKSQTNQAVQEGEVVNGAVIAINNDFVTVDIGYKMEGMVPISEFRDAEGKVK